MSEPEVELVPEAELVALFRKRRPDPAAFRARVAERVAQRVVQEQREPDADAPDRRSIVRAEFLRRAAAFLPLDPGGGAAFGKVFVTSLALPFLVLAASIGAFVAAGRSVLRTASSAEPAAREPRLFDGHVRPRSGRLGLSGLFVQGLHAAGVIVLALPAATGSRWAVDILVGLILLAGLILVVVVRWLGDSAQMTPRTVSRYALAILLALLSGAFLSPLSVRAAAASTELGLGWSVGVLFAGVVVCALLPRGGAGFFGWLAILAVPVLLFVSPMGLTRSSPASLRAQIASYGVEARDLTGWEQFGFVAEALKAVGEDVPALPDVERELDAALGRDASRTWTKGVDAHPRVWTAASQAGLMTRERWLALSRLPLEQHRLDQLLKLRGPLHLTEYHEYELPMLVATRTLTDHQRESLAARIDATWPQAGSHDPLGKALLVVRLMDHVGLAERTDGRRDAVHALLEEHWTGHLSLGSFQVLGGFTSDAQKFTTSLTEPTHTAVVLMARFGAPASVDLRLVREYLRGESATHSLGLRERAYLKGTARAALLRLERQVGIPPRSFLAAIVGERVLIAAVLLVLLCVVAISSAPEPGRSRSVALP